MPAAGLLLVDKPKGATSFDIVRQVKRRLQIKRVGHAGTLDPLATGLLVIAFGRATRLIRFVQDRPKVYRTEVTFGIRSATEDAEGPFEQVEMSPPSEGEISAALKEELGERDQLPPIYSAKKIDGKRAYSLARSGEEVVMKPARVIAHRLVLERWEPGPFTCRAEHADDAAAAFNGVGRATILCEVGKGYYIRSLARDLGERLGGGAYMSSLRRLSIGDSSVDAAIDGALLDEDSPELAAALAKGIQEPWSALSGFPHILAGSGVLNALLKGQKPEIPELDGLEHAVLCDEIGPALLVHKIGDCWKIDVNLYPLRDDLA